MKAGIEVADREEAELIRLGLENKEMRAMVKVIGALSRLPTTRAKQRTLEYVAGQRQPHDRSLRTLQANPTFTT